MPEQIAGLNYWEVTFDTDCNLQADGGLADAVGAGGIQDLFILSHGWNCGVDSARGLYHDMFALLAKLIPNQLASTAVAGLMWPSLLFPDDDPATAQAAASSGPALAAALAPAFPAQQQNVARIGELLAAQPQDPARLTEFHELAKGLVTTPDLGAVEDTGETAAITKPTAAVLGYYAGMAKTGAPGAEGLPNPFDTLWHGAREVLRTLSYYEMKNRAGVVGRSGLGPFLGRLVPGGNLRVHLMGHSFGARLVAYALSGLPAGMAGAASPVKSLLLIQGAFSHFSFANPMSIDPGRSGALAGFADRVDGPLLATVSEADRAVGWWYPAASMLKHEDSQSSDDLSYRWGAMGHDGYQQAGVVSVTLAAPGQDYAFGPNTCYRLDANAVIAANQSAFSGAHSDIRHAEILWAAANAAKLGG